jgi:non-heme chloroperoxidase
VLLLHGYSDSSFSFSRILPLLPPDWRVIAPDQRGHGDSGCPEDGYTPDHFARDGIHLMDSLGIARATVVGHSMGSFVAQHMAWLAPERVARLVLVGSFTTARNEPVLALAESVANLTDPVDVSFIREFQMSTVCRPVPSEFMERVIAESRKLPAHVWKAVMAGLLGSDSSLQLGSIRCPVLIIWGDQDAIFSRAEQDKIAGLVEGAELRVEPGVGHDPQWEDPEAFVRHLVAFCGSQKLRNASAVRSMSPSVCAAEMNAASN